MCVSNSVCAHPVLCGPRVNPLNPECPEVPLFVLPAHVGMLQGLGDPVPRDRDDVLRPATEALGQVQYLRLIDHAGNRKVGQGLAGWGPQLAAAASGATCPSACTLPRPLQVLLLLFFLSL